jgi:hypothetical protein
MRSRILAIAAIAAVCLTAGATPPVGYVAVSGSHLTDFGGALISNATITWAPVDNYGNPLPARINGAGQGIIRPVSATVTSGVFTVTVADTTLTSPVNVCYKVTVTDQTTGNVLLSNGYTCVQPAGSGTAVTGTNAWCTAAGGGSGGTCNFDSYVPNLAGQAVVQTGPTGPAGPAGLTGGILIAPSSDTSGTTDNAAIQAAITAGKTAQLEAGNYYITGLTFSAPSDVFCSDSGTTNIFMVSTTNNFFTLNYGGGQLNNESLGMTIRSCNLFYKSGVTPTAGDAFNLAGIDSTHVLSGVHIENNTMWGLWGGIRVGAQMVNNWFTNNLGVGFLSGGDGCIFYNTAVPGGDAHFDGSQCIGAHSNLTIAQADTTEFTNLKLNGGAGLIFTGAATTQKVRFINPSIEGTGNSGGSPSCGVDFGSGGVPAGISFIGGGIGLLPQAFCLHGNQILYSYTNILLYSGIIDDSGAVPVANQTYTSFTNIGGVTFGTNLFNVAPYFNASIGYTSLGCTSYLGNCYPNIYMMDSTSGTDAHLTAIQAALSAWQLVFANDAVSASAVPLKISRSGYTPLLATLGEPIAITGTKFTASGCSNSATAGGASAGVFTIGATSCTVVVTISGATGATAPNGWTCQAHDRTHPTVLIGGESSSTTTTASITIPAGASTSDVISFSCTAY